MQACVQCVPRVLAHPYIPTTVWQYEMRREWHNEQNRNKEDRVIAPPPLVPFNRLRVCANVSLRSCEHVQTLAKAKELDQEQGRYGT